jgi:hypothetical protein
MNAAVVLVPHARLRSPAVGISCYVFSIGVAPEVPCLLCLSGNLTDHVFLYQRPGLSWMLVRNPRAEFEVVFGAGSEAERDDWVRAISAAAGELGANRKSFSGSAQSSRYGSTACR